MPLTNPFSTVLSNPLVMATLATQAAGGLAGQYNNIRAQNEAQQQREFLDASLAEGHPVTSIPRTGLLSHILGPETASPDIQNQEQIALGQQRQQSLKTLTEFRKDFGPGVVNSPYFSTLLKQAGADPSLFAGPTPQEQALTRQTEALQNTERHQQQVETRLDQQHQDTVANQEANRADREAQNASTNALRDMTIQNAKEAREATQRIENERNDDARRNHFDTSVEKLNTDRQKVSAMLSSANPADQKTVQTLLDSLNARGTDLQKQAEKYNYDFNPDEFQPLKLGDKPGFFARTFQGKMQAVEPDTSVAAEPTIPAGARAGRDASGKIVGYSLNGKWNPI